MPKRSDTPCFETTMSHTPELIEYTSQPLETTDSPEKALFLERLDTFMQKSLAEIQAFAQRESKSYDEVEWIMLQLIQTYI